MAGGLEGDAVVLHGRDDWEASIFIAANNDCPERNIFIDCLHEGIGQTNRIEGVPWTKAGLAGRR
jgi:hypothetical protein